MGGAVVAQEKSAYAKYCEDKGIVGIGVFVPKELDAMVRAACDKEDVKVTEWARRVFADAVNAAGLKHEDGSDWKYTAPAKAAKESVKAQLERQAKEIEELRKQLQDRAPQNPPAVMADPATGKVVAK